MSMPPGHRVSSESRSDAIGEPNYEEPASLRATFLSRLRRQLRKIKAP